MNKNSKKTWTNLIDGNEKKYLLWIFLLALVLRIVYVLEIQGAPFVEHLFSDPEIYDGWGWKLATEGGWFGSRVFFMAPIYPVFLGIVYLFVGHSAFTVLILQSLISSMTVIAIYLIGRELFSKQIGIIAALIASVYAVFIFYAGNILSETLQTFVYSILIYAIVKFDSFDKKYDWFGFGMLVGVAALFRGNILLFVAAVVIWMLINYLRRRELKKNIRTSLLFFILGLAVPILPATMNNYFASNDFVLLTSNGGINFYIGNHENSPGVFITPRQFDYYNDMAGHRYAEEQLKRKLTPSEASAYWYGKGFKFIINNPGKASKLFLKKLVLFFGAGENAQSSIMNDEYFAEHYSKVLQLPLIKFFFVSVFGLLGLFIYFREKKKNMLLLIFFFTFVLATVIFFVNGRFRMAITPLLIVFTAYAIVSVIEFVREKNIGELKIPVALVTAFILVYNFGVSKPKFNEYDALIQLGRIAYDEKDYNKAIEYYNKSLFYRDDYTTYMNIGNALAMKKDFKNAVNAFTKAIARNPSDPMVHFNLGFAYSQSGNFDLAIQSYQNALDLDNSFISAYRNIGIIYYIQEKWDEALFYFNKFLSLSDDEELNKSVKYDIEQIQLRMKADENKNKNSN